MAKRQGSGGVTGRIHWMLAVILTLWSHHISGQGQGRRRSFTVVFLLLGIAWHWLENGECKMKC